MTCVTRTRQLHRSRWVVVETHHIPAEMGHRREHRVMLDGQVLGLVGSVVSGLRLGRTVVDLEEEGRGRSLVGAKSRADVVTPAKVPWVGLSPLRASSAP